MFFFSIKVVSENCLRTKQMCTHPHRDNHIYTLSIYFRLSYTKVLILVSSSVLARHSLTFKIC